MALSTVATAVFCGGLVYASTVAEFDKKAEVVTITKAQLEPVGYNWFPLNTDKGLLAIFDNYALPDTGNKWWTQNNLTRTAIALQNLEEGETYCAQTSKRLLTPDDHRVLDKLEPLGPNGECSLG